MTDRIHEACRIGVGVWSDTGPDEICRSIHRELERLGHRAEFFRIKSGSTPSCDVLLFYGPYGPFLSSIESIEATEQRPRVVFWNTEGLPDLRIPRSLMASLARWRLYVADLDSSNHPLLLRLTETSVFRSLNDRMTRFLYLGQYMRSADNGWIDLLVDISAVYARILSSQLPIPVSTAPFGSMHSAGEDLSLERDIDVLWIGKRASRRRSRRIDRIRARIQKRGVRLHVVDGVENPFVFGKERTILLNRSKITLNLLRTWYDENTMRHCLAAPNRSLIVSELLLPHVPSWEAGRHYVAAPPARLADTICHYLENEEERLQIADNAYRLVNTRLTMARSIRTIMQALENRVEVSKGA